MEIVKDQILPIPAGIFWMFLLGITIFMLFFLFLLLLLRL